MKPWGHLQELRPVSEQGGQSESFFALGAEGQELFVKVLKRQNDTKARGRFRREVAAYETLRVPGIPVLVEHNAHLWQGDTALYLALERVSGENVGQLVRRTGAVLPVESALELVDRLSQTLSACHELGVIHRDIKPQNIMVQGEPVCSPFLVDFGLSFNDSDETDLTDVREEVGNRFLRLPEHVWGSRSPVSDVTQLAGVLLFALTGVEPRVLLDGNGTPPHLRPLARKQLDEQLDGKARRRLLRLFDIAFATPEANRFQSAADLRQAARGVLVSDTSDDADDPEADFAVALSDPGFLEHVAQSRTLAEYVKVAQSVYFTIAKGNGLQTHQTGYAVEAGENPGYGHTRLGLSLRSSDEPAWLWYRFELRSPTEAVLVVNQEDIWRGTSSSDPELAKVIRATALRALLSRDG